jgi:DNA-binding beta-propeller fold protein YncE
VNDTSTKRPRGGSRGRKLIGLPALFLLAAVVGSASLAGLAGAISPTGEEKFDAATWKPTLEAPLPPMDGPLTFNLSDEPAYWYDNGRPDLEGILHTRSLAAGVAGVPTKVKFEVAEPYTSENHTVSSIVWPVGAKNVPFVQQGSFTGTQEFELSEPGLYVFQCRVHPYMLGAVVNDDPTTPGADLGKKVHWIDGTEMPTAADEILFIVQKFFIVTEPANWQYYSPDHDVVWDPQFPQAPIMTYHGDGSPNLIPNLHEYYQEKYSFPQTLKAPPKPDVQGVGEALVDTQFEMSAGKTKPGSITAFDTSTWEMTKKLFLPEINLNNPHNMAVSRDQKTLFQSQWFSNKVTAVDLATGKALHSTEVGPSPSHVMRRPGSETLLVPNNGGNRVVELDPTGGKVIRSYFTQAPGEDPAFPHAHWVSYDGKHVVTPNSNESNASLFNLSVPAMVKPFSGGFPVATSMTNDGKRAYVANLLDHTIRCMSVDEAACPTPDGKIVEAHTIDLRQNYDKVSGKSTGPYALSPIQLPISPDDSYMLVVGTFTGNVLQIDMKTNRIVKSFDGCGPGCHGINFGAKKGGGYLGYVSVKFNNLFWVIDGDPNGDGDLTDSRMTGAVLTSGSATKINDDTPRANFGQGGQGVWAVPDVYNGWVQELPPEWKRELTCQQQDPLKKAVC